MDETERQSEERGWATAKDVLNTRPVEGFLAALKDGRPGQRAKRRA